MLSNMTKGIKSNNLKDFKTYLDNNTKIKDYVLDINYKYNITLNIYKNNKDKIIKVNPNDLFSSLMGNNNYQSSYSNYNVFTEMLDNQEVLKNQYEVLAGKYATEENELMLITNSNNEISDYVLYTLGIKDQMELQSIIAKVMKGESVSVNKTTYNYDDLLNLEYKLVLPTSYYQKVNNKYNKIEDEEGIKKLIQEGMTLKIVGIIKEKENATSLAINGSIAYNKKLIQKVIQEINNSQIVKDQLNNKNINILTNEKFDNLTTYEDILNQLNVYDFDNPSSINLYMKDFESKKSVVKLINEYNKKQRENNLEENVIHYTDLVGTMIGSVSSIVNTISYVLIAFVTISLVVSSIMIGIITYISVIERTKEIGILRAIGASKKDISRVFNAETIIIGFTSGLFGIIITILLNIPINIIIKNITNISNISKLPIIGGIVLIIISIILTLIGGLIPAKIASKKDPVEALRVE